MSKRSSRKVRHRPDAPKVFSFKQRVQMGIITGKINRKEITLDEIRGNPSTSWMLEAWQEVKQEAMEQVEMMALPSEFPAQANEPSDIEVSDESGS